VELVVSPDSQRTVQNWLNSEAGSGSRALSCPVNLRRQNSQPLRIITNAVTQSATIENEISSEAQAHLKQETTIFMDDSPGTDLKPETYTSDISMDAYKADASLAKFLSRPTVVYNTVWSVGAGLNLNVPVWLNFFDTTAIKNKLENYAYIKCDLKIKILINASPFYYGLAAAIYNPLPSTNSAPIDGTTTDLIPYSQRPLVWLYPQESRGGVITAPFIYPKTWLELKSATDFTNMGSLDLRTFVDLQNANSVAGTDCDVIVYAWAENVYLCGPTNDPVLQSSVKKGSGNVQPLTANISNAQCDMPKSSTTSKVASKAEFTSSTAGTISEPLRDLAQYAGVGATAAGALGFEKTAVAARGISSAAKILSVAAKTCGYTDNPIIRDITGFKSLPFHGFSSTEISEPRDKLTFDPKCSLTKSPGAADIVARSDTRIAALAARESYLTQFTWDATKTFNSLLWAAAVSPNLMDVEGVGDAAIFNLTPAAWLTRPFLYWRGDVVFRFRFICSPYHRGRVRITWDPTDDLDLIPDTTATNYNRIVDISEDVDVIIKVPYLKSTAMMEVSKVNAARYGAAGSTNSATTDNGKLTISTLTQQTSPVASADITVVVSTWVENLIVSNPTNIPHYQSYVVQSLSKYAEGKPAMPLFDGTVTSDDFFEEYGGENVIDVIQLMRRKTLSRHDMWLSDATSAINVIGILFRRTPLYSGYDINGVDSAVDLIGGGNSPFNFNSVSYLNYFRKAFISMRGSINWTFNVTGGQYLEHLSIKRYPLSIGGVRYTANNIPATDTRDQKKSKLIAPNTSSCTPGMGLTNTRTQTSLSVAAPMYSRYKWQLNSPEFGTTGTTFDDSNQDNLFLEIFTQPANNFDPDELILHSYVSAGEDFSLQFFLNVPSLYSTNTPLGAP